MFNKYLSYKFETAKNIRNVNTLLKFCSAIALFPPYDFRKNPKSISFYYLCYAFGFSITCPIVLILPNITNLFGMHKTSSYLDMFLIILSRSISVLSMLVPNFCMIFVNHHKCLVIIKRFLFVENKLESATIREKEIITRVESSIKKAKSFNFIKYEMLSFGILFFIFTMYDVTIMGFMIWIMFIPEYLYGISFYLLLLLIINFVLFVYFKLYSINLILLNSTSVQNIRIVREVYEVVSDIVFSINDVFGWAILICMGDTLSSLLQCANIVLKFGFTDLMYLLDFVVWAFYMLVSVTVNPKV